jgi:predicted negative regulator of RcsB-dependent stress response
MDEDIALVNRATNIEKIKNFFINNKKRLIFSVSILLVLVFVFFIYLDIKKKNQIKLADKYNYILNEFALGNEANLENELIEIINSKDKTYSPLALYFLIDNDFKKTNEEINLLFDVLIENTKLDKEIKNLVIYKKALFNSESETENNLINILNPVLNSSSIWKSHALYLLGEYFYSKNEKQKAKEFFEKILDLENGNVILKNESKKRIQRDLSD